MNMKTTDFELEEFIEFKRIEKSIIGVLKDKDELNPIVIKHSGLSEKALNKIVCIMNNKLTGD